MGGAQRVLSKALEQPFTDVHDLFDKMRELLPQDLMTELPKGRFPMAAAAIRDGVKQRMAKFGALRSLECGPDGIHMDVALRRRIVWGRIRYAGRLVVRGMSINRNVQQMVVEVRDEKLLGDDLWGYILAPPLSVIIEAVYGGLLERGATGTDAATAGVTKVVGRKNTFEVDLSGLDAIRALQRPIAFDRSVFDVIEINGCTHADGKILLSGRIAILDSVMKAEGERTDG